MAKVIIKNIAKVEESVRKKLADAIQSDELLGEIGETLVKNIKAKARLGKEPESDNAFAPLDGGKRGTIYQRKKMAAYNPVGDFFRAPKSNLTFSGQLLDSIIYVVKKVGGFKQIQIGPKGKRRPYLNKDGSVREGGIETNEELGTIHQSTRRFLGVSDRMKQQVINKVKAHLRRLLKMA